VEVISQQLGGLMSIATLLKRLDEEGAIGLDLSPGDPLCKEAANVIRQLLKELHPQAKWN
jgi:hypothetical protein